jgi:hypothetical protein
LIFGEQKLDYSVICKIPFGAYAQVHVDLDIMNTMESRTTRAINLGPTGNIQGAHKFFSLKIGEIIVQRTWTELPVPNDVIDRLDEMTLDKEDCNMENFEGAEKESIQSKNELLIEPGDSEEIEEEFVEKNAEGER